RVLLPLLAGRPERRAVLIGRDGGRFVEDFVGRHPALRGQLEATGALPAAEVPSWMRACDVMLQPYPDGASTRRTSLMAALALGMPTVTTEGLLSEPLWRTCRAVALAAADDAAALLAQTEAVLNDPLYRRDLGARAGRLYREQFSVEQ